MKKTRKAVRVKKKLKVKNSSSKPVSTRLSLEEQISAVLKGIGSSVSILKSNDKTESIFIYAADFHHLESREEYKALSQRQQELIRQRPQTLHRAQFKEQYLLIYWRETDQSEDEAILQLSAPSKIRDLGGSVFAEVQSLQIKSLLFLPLQSSIEVYQNFALGWELAAYRFKTLTNPIKTCKAFIEVDEEKPSPLLEALQYGSQLARATNFARHLVNLPGNILNTASYAKIIQQVFSKLPSVQVSIWDERKLKAEKMNLHLAVGKGAEHGPRLVHLRYRPKGIKGAKPLAFVGKGITFDSGGLDIKPSSGMRWMKKDMGGSASLVGFAWWCVTQKIQQPMDFYFALAENAVSSRSFRPGDILTARSGLRVEIHNTDAEGRLVLADALDVAVKQDTKNQPELVVDVATLTGAIKIALGAQIAGLFSNHRDLQEELYEAGQATGDFCWPMPLYQGYRTSMSSNFADMTNSVDGFAGAVTAALFLESFVNKTPWAHLDIYAWKDGAEGALLETGASGQGVQLLAKWIMTRLGQA